jgi:signal transduction histidine kinase
MRSRFGNLSIRHKLTAIIMATSSAALLLACAAFVLHDRFDFRRRLVGDLSTLAAIIGSHSAEAILFNDAKVAGEALAALKAEPRITWACIYNQRGEVFAHYVRGGGALTLPLTPPAPGPRFADDRLRLAAPIVLDGERIGTIVLESGLDEIGSRLQRYVGISALVLAASLLVALVLSANLQRVISVPIQRLVRTAAAVSEGRDFSLRATKTGDDELGALVGTFNAMLEQIQQRNAALTGSLAHLQKTQDNLIERTLEVESINRELARSNRELEGFASVASHDLQEPLRKIMAFGDRLRTRCAEALDETGQDYLARMQNAAVRMQTLIDDLLAFSRITTQAQPFAPVSLDQVVREVLSDLELRIEKTGARIELGELPAIEADPLQMRQMFQNLLSNALKFQRPEAPPLVKVTSWVVDGDATLSRRYPAAFGLCQITVEDNGIGFDEKYADRLFQPFQRLNPQSAYEGTGIGLAICSKIAERHGGRITAASTPGQGSRFLVTLPRRQRGEPS